MFPCEAILGLEATLSPMLDQLQRGGITGIQYGDVFRIKYIPTLGGNQYAVKQLSLGAEGSGIYHPDRKRLLVTVADLMMRHHAPSKLFLKRSEEACEWSVLDRHGVTHACEVCS